MKKKIINILPLIISATIGGMIGAIREKTVEDKKVKENKQMSDKHLALYLMMNQWVKVKQEGKSLASYFEEKGYREIAIYGMSYAGEALVRELEGTGIRVKYGIDAKAVNIYTDIEVVTPDDVNEEVDVIVVTPITFFDEIEIKLSEKVNCPIISLEDILDEIKLI